MHWSVCQILRPAGSVSGKVDDDDDAPTMAGHTTAASSLQ